MAQTIRWGACVLALLCALPARAADIRLGGQVRPRFEAHDPGTDGNRDTFTSMRVRAHLSAVTGDGVSAFLELQDVRLWGEESGTLADYRADNLDLHQGYFELRRGASGAVQARVGRQAVRVGNERLVGAVDWAQQGRSFDGVRLSVRPQGWMLDLFAARLSESSAPGIDRNGYMACGHLQIGRRRDGALDLLAVYNRDSKGSPTDQVTLGGRWGQDGEAFSHHVEGYYQAGDRAGVDVSAFMFGARAGVAAPRDRIAISGWYDYLSGDDDPADGTQKAFDTLFATNHGYYGHADVFTDLPAHTGGRGLQDLGARVSVAPVDRLVLSADGHAFYAARKPAGDARRFGHELDLAVRAVPRRSLTLQAGVSWFYAADGLADAGRFGHDLRFVYLLADVSF